VHVVKPKQEGENPLIGSLKAKKRVKDYLDGLGLAIDLRAAGEHKFLNADAQNLYDSVTNLVADSKLPTELPILRLEYSKPTASSEKPKFGYRHMDSSGETITAEAHKTISTSANRTTEQRKMFVYFRKANLTLIVSRLCFSVWSQSVCTRHEWD
jgi:hypothetical protein